MKYFCIFLCVTSVAVGVCGENLNIEIPVNSADKATDVKVADATSDQKTDGNTNNYYGGNIRGLNYYGGGYGKYFGRDIEEFFFDNKLRENRKFERSREHNTYYRFDEGNPDIHGRIRRPCQAYDTFCIRKFFAEHSKCKISGRQVPEPLFRAQATLNFPITNMSATLVNMEYKGIKDGRIEEFYIDKVTDNLVLTVDFDAVSLETANVNLKYYLRGREPIVTRDVGAVTYVNLTITVVIPNVKDLRLERAEIFTYPREPLPPFVLGPRLGISTDPEVPLMFAEFVAKLPITTREALLTEGVFYVSNFIQYNICDFGLKVL